MITSATTNSIVVNANAFGTTSITGANTTFLGTTTLTQGILSMGNAAALGSANTNTITINGPNAAISSGVALANDVVLNGTNNLNLTVTPGGFGGATFSGAISGDGGVVLRSGAYILANAANSYTGPTVINGGSLLVTSSVPATGGGLLGNPASGNETVVIGRSFGSGGAGVGALALNALVSAELAINNTGTITFDRPISAPTGPMRAGITDFYNATATFTGPINNKGRLVLDLSNNPYTFAGSITGTGSLDLTFGSASFTNTANSYSGGTYLTAGTLFVDVPGALGTGSIIDANTFLSGSGTTPDFLPHVIATNLIEGVTIIPIQNTSSAGFVKAGGGTVFLGAASGALYVSNNNQLGNAANPMVFAGGSIMWAAGSGAFPRSIIVGDGGGALKVVAGNAVTASDVTGNGALIKAGTGTHTLKGVNTCAGRTVISP